jgi:hypothetical protein
MSKHAVLFEIFSEREMQESFFLNDPASASDCTASVVDKWSKERSNGGIILMGKNLSSWGENLFWRLSVRPKSHVDRPYIQRARLLPKNQSTNRRKRGAAGLT